MKTYSFYGASDDLVEWCVVNEEGLSDNDEIGCFSKNSDGVNCSITLRSKSEGECRVFAIYGLGEGVWGFGIAQTEEEKEIPEWPVLQQFA